MWPPDQYWCPKPILGPQKGFKVQHKNILLKMFKNLLLINYNVLICKIAMQSSSDSVVFKLLEPWSPILVAKEGFKVQNLNITRMINFTQ